MLTKEQISGNAFAANPYDEEKSHYWQQGATWANQQNATELAALRAENAKLRDVLETALSEGMKTQAGRNAVRNALNATTPDPLYLAAPEMLELLQDISSPRRGSESENWQVDPRVVQLAARLVDKATFNPADLDEF